jgi:hypothetical protein
VRTRADESASMRAARGGGNKKPASKNGAGRRMEIGARLSRRRCCPRPPSRLSGRRASLCCAMSGFFDSLSSAGHVCWAKPNHGFFQCQHLGAIIFMRPRAQAGRSRPLRLHGCRPLARRRTAIARKHFNESAFFQHFCFTRSQMRQHCTALPRDAHSAVAHAWRRYSKPENNWRSHADFRVAQSDLRGTAQAIRPRRAPCERRTMRFAATKKPASSPARVERCGCRNATSGRRRVRRRRRRDRKRAWFRWCTPAVRHRAAGTPRRATRRRRSSSRRGVRPLPWPVSEA